MSVITVQDTQWLNRWNRGRMLPAQWADDTASEVTPECPDLDVDAIFAEITELLEPPSILDADPETYGRHAYIEPELDALEALAKAEAYNRLQLGLLNLRHVPAPSVADFIDAVQDSEGSWTAVTGQTPVRLALPSVDTKAGDKMAAGFAAAGIALNVDGHRDDTWGERIHDRIERAVIRLFRRRS